MSSMGVDPHSHAESRSLFSLPQKMLSGNVAILSCSNQVKGTKKFCFQVTILFWDAYSPLETKFTLYLGQTFLTAFATRHEAE